MAKEAEKEESARQIATISAAGNVPIAAKCTPYWSARSPCWSKLTEGVGIVVKLVIKDVNARSASP